jgi:ATP-binding cassette subfamily B protein RaxB
MRPTLQSESSESSECGLACLVMVANTHRLQLDLSEVRRRFAVSLKGATLQQLITHAGQLNFNSRPLRLELDELPQLQLPCILHWDLNHFVVLKKVGRGHITILDPAVGERKPPMAEVGMMLLYSPKLAGLRPFMACCAGWPTSRFARRRLSG